LCAVAADRADDFARSVSRTAAWPQAWKTFTGILGGPRD